VFESLPKRVAQLRCPRQPQGIPEPAEASRKIGFARVRLRAYPSELSGYEHRRMAESHTKTIIRFLKGSKDSIEDITNIVLNMWDKGIGPTHEGTTRSDVESDLGISLNYAAKTGLEHAVDTRLVERDPEDSDDLPVYVIAEWMNGGSGDVVNGNVDDAAEEAIEAIIDHIHATDPSGSTAVADGGLTVRDVVADEFTAAASAIEGRLRRGDLVENVNTAVEAIEESSHVSMRSDYGRITFRYGAFNYRLTPLAVTLFNL